MFSEHGAWTPGLPVGLELGSCGSSAERTGRQDAPTEPPLSWWARLLPAPMTSAPLFRRGLEVGAVNRRGDKRMLAGCSALLTSHVLPSLLILHLRLQVQTLGCKAGRGQLLLCSTLFAPPPKVQACWMSGCFPSLSPEQLLVAGIHLHGHSRRVIS